MKNLLLAIGDVGSAMLAGDQDSLANAVNTLTDLADQYDGPVADNIIHRECFSRLLAETDPDDGNACRLIIVRRGEGGYYNTAEVRFGTVDDMNELNRTVYGVSPEEAEEIATQSFALGNLTSRCAEAESAATDMRSCLQQIFDAGDEPTYLDLEDTLNDYEQYAPDDEDEEEQHRRDEKNGLYGGEVNVAN